MSKDDYQRLLRMTKLKKGRKIIIIKILLLKKEEKWSVIVKNDEIKYPFKKKFVFDNWKFSSISLFFDKEKLSKKKLSIIVDNDEVP